MTIIAAILICLVLKVIHAVQSECDHVVSCPCGSSGENITVCIPVPTIYVEVCTRLSKCESCEEGSNVCLKCLQGLEGVTCSQEKSKFRQKRQMYYPTRNWQKPTSAYRQNCPNVDSPKLGSIRCVSSSDHQTCTGKCLPGYHFTSSSEDEMTLTCVRGVWTPRTSFPNCKTGGHCDLIVTGAGAFNCTTGMDGTRCDVICSGRYAGRFFCYPGQEWEPPLPRCVQPKHGDTGGRTACRCKNGGTCDSNGRCVCSSDWMGNVCEIAIPRKKTCQDPGFVLNGFRRNADGSEAMTKRTFEEGQSVVYYCNSDKYALQGTSILVCKSDGTWSHRLPNCIQTVTAAPKKSCEDPGFVPNGFRRNPDGSEAMTRRTFEEGQSVVYNCNSDKYALQGSSILVCKPDGTWSHHLPNCIQTATAAPELVCPDPGQRSNSYRLNPDGSRVIGVRTSYLSGHSLAYTCHAGFALQGQSLITCLASGKWSSRTPYCTRIPSPTPSTLGTPKPTAEQKFCKDPLVDQHGIRDPKTSPDRRGFPPGTALQYSCKPGYDLVGATTIFCLIQGFWSSDRPRCTSQARTTPNPQLIYCPYPGDIANGRVMHVPPLNERKRPVDEIAEAYPEFSALEYFCDDGYILEGSMIVECLKTGSWSARPPTCRKVPSPLKYCPYPGDVLNGRVDHLPALNERKRPVGEKHEQYPEGSRLQYFCDDGYNLEGTAILECQNTGSWSARPPTCEGDELSTCETPGRFANGQVTYQPAGQTSSITIVTDDNLYEEGSRLNYSCNKGYALMGLSSTLTCENTGFWSGNPPTCRKIKNRAVCKHPGIVGNAQVVHIPPPKNRQITTNEGWEEYPPGSQLLYSCGPGYTLQGPEALYCQNNGSWTENPPTCINEIPSEIMYCENPVTPLNGRAKYYPPAIDRGSGQGLKPDSDQIEYPEQGVLEYSCDDGFQLQGRRSITCQSTGYWSGEIPQCVPDCGRSFIQTVHRVTNGSKTVSGDWPWVVSISVEEDDGSTTYICGGAVLNVHAVITAAHCLSGAILDGKTLILRFGKHYFSNEADDEQVLTRRSSRMIVHPDYSNRTMDSDIGLVMFEPRIRYSHRVQPLCLPTRETTLRNVEPGRVGNVGGWGLTEDETSPSVMMLASLPVVSDRQCESSYSNLNLIITSNMFCAGYDDARQSVCRGDSGSPFVFYDRRKERYTLEGVVSFGVRGQCGVSGKYAIFTKVFRFLTWILRNSK